MCIPDQSSNETDVSLGPGQDRYWHTQQPAKKRNTNADSVHLICQGTRLKDRTISDEAAELSLYHPGPKRDWSPRSTHSCPLRLQLPHLLSPPPDIPPRLLSAFFFVPHPPCRQSGDPACDRRQSLLAGFQVGTPRSIGRHCSLCSPPEVRWREGRTRTHISYRRSSGCRRTESSRTSLVLSHCSRLHPRTRCRTGCTPPRARRSPPSAGRGRTSRWGESR
mmetsp:Transcript_3114/g.8134  ORF Transcript_3114/g.8134 Transcript_3114/m.8134 type:complete len:221 (+) Transcript_3114:2109-2771(+)